MSAESMNIKRVLNLWTSNECWIYEHQMSA